MNQIAPQQAAQASANHHESGDWEVAIDRYLKRRKVEGGLSANSFEAYSTDLLDFREFCPRLRIEPKVNRKTAG